MGLKIDRRSVTCVITGDVHVAYHVLLGDIPPDKYIKGKMIYLIWLWQNFQQLIDRDDVIAQHAKAHIMMLKGRYLMQDTSRTKVYFMYLFLLSNLTDLPLMSSPTK